VSDDSQTPKAPIDGLMPPPPSTRKDHDYLTRDLESALDMAVIGLVNRVAAGRGIGRRAAVPIVLQILNNLPATEGSQ